MPALQLGPGSIGTWSYDTTSQTHVVTPVGGMFEVNAYANFQNQIPWDAAGQTDTTRYAYLVVAAQPASTTDIFDITVENDGGTLTLFDSGYGTPPVQDTNNLAPHGIFDSWYEIYQFQFDGSLVTVNDTQPGTSGSVNGYAEALKVTINSSSGNLHMDLFTVTGDGNYDATNTTSSNKFVKNFAPFSHDAQQGCCPPPPYEVSEPAPLAVLGVGLIALGWIRRRRTAADV